MTSIHGNGVQSTFGYRNDNLLASINTPTVSGATNEVGNYSYGYDANKNKTSETITGTLAGFGFGTGLGAATVYDDEDRLTAWNRADGILDRSWDLSLVGDWNSVTQNTVTETRDHTAAHEISAINGTALDHDAKGNMTKNDEGFTFVWDFDNRLQSATIPAGATDATVGTHDYTYDALGRRVSKSDSDDGTTTTTLFICAGQQVICEYDVPAGGSPTVTAPDQKYVYASYVDEPILKDGKFSDGTNSGIVYYSRNQQFSVTALSDSVGNVVERYAYTAYGKITIFNGAGGEISASEFANPYTYTARRSDPETGLMYFRARYYDPNLGEFISRDPLGYVDGMSLYRAYFVPGAVDPSGLACNDNGGRYQYISGRGFFSSFTHEDLNDKDLRSRFYGFWNPDETKFENKPCNCCSEIGTVQIFTGIKVIRKSNSILENFFSGINEWVNERDWQIDGTYPYQDNFPEFRTIDPTTKQSLMHHDAPGDKIRKFGQGATYYASQDFEFCVVCLKGTEKNAVYGCAKWGHEFQLKTLFFDPKLKDYRIRRYIDLVGGFKEYDQKGLSLAGRKPSTRMKNFIVDAQAGY